MEASKNISAIVAAQRLASTPEGRMAEAAAIANFARTAFPLRRRNQNNAGSVLSRLMEKVIFGTSECWYWRGSTDDAGYGRMSALGENFAHRVSYAVFNGEIPDGMKVLHTCDTRCCVNPAHLEIGTQADNVADMVAKGRQVNADVRGERNPMAKLTVAVAQAIRTGYAAGGISMATLAAKHGVSTMTVCRVVNNQLWREVQ